MVAHSSGSAVVIPGQTEAACVANLQANQKQLDPDGIMVGVSRQALDETLAMVGKLTAENRDLRAIPWPRAYILDRASEWTRLLREVGGYLKTCRGSCGSDIAGRDHAIAAADAIIAMLAEARTANAVGTQPQSCEVNPESPTQTLQGQTNG